MNLGEMQTGLVGQGPGFYISNKLSGGAHAVGPDTFEYRDLITPV